MERIRVPRVSGGRPRTRPEHVLADRAYSSRQIRSYLRKRGIAHTIPEKRYQAGHRIRRGSAGGRPPGFDHEMYKRRHKVECRIGLLKQVRGVATRYDKLAVRYESTVQLTLIRQTLRPHLTRGLDQGWSAVLLPVHAREELDDAVDLGLLNAAFGVRALTGSLVYGAVGSRFRRWPVFTIAFVIGGLPRFVVAAFTDTFTPLAVIMAVEGLAFGVLNPIMATLTYEMVPEELRSRVLSVTTASVQLATPLGGLAAGSLVDSAGLSTTLLTVGGAYLITTLCPVIFPA